VAPSLHIKPKDPKQFVTPAPGAYNPDGADKDVKEAAPKYSFGIKTKVKIEYVSLSSSWDLAINSDFQEILNFSCFRSFICPISSQFGIGETPEKEISC